MIRTRRAEFPACKRLEMDTAHVNVFVCSLPVHADKANIYHQCVRSHLSLPPLIHTRTQMKCVPVFIMSSFFVCAFVDPLEEVCPAGGVQTQTAVPLPELESRGEGKDQ